MARTPLHDWLGRKLGQEPSRDSLASYHLARLRETLAYVRERSPYHRDRLAGLAEGFPPRLKDMARLPFTTPDDLRRHHLAMLCVSQDQVARVVTLRTSGTTAPPKRIYFSDRDLELTLDFFQHGMSTMVEPGDCVLILLPGSTPDSVGDLLARALARMQVRALAHGPVADPALALAEAERRGAHCLVGIPVQALALAEHPGAERLQGRLKSALLTTDYVPRALAERIRRAWSCEIFEHYGMTETGLGGGVDCRAHAGYHLRGADLYYEVVEPQSGTPLPPGEEGELVVTTLTRQAMPLLRYRTGDLGRLLPEACPCGGATPRLDRVRGRLGNHLLLPGGARLPMWRLDEVLFAVAGLLDYRIRLTADGGARRLQLTARALPGKESGLGHEITRALAAIPELGRSLAGGGVKLEPVKIASQAWASDGTSKRTL
ncbi:hypothetical protein AAU61_07165 [Desulfocarbo indianensis]|nr:hypothetical protein AAU61_07165 [Desulfocarbo indianensis]